MGALETAPRSKTPMHLLITDSGLGGLSVCAETERALRKAEGPKSGTRRATSDSGHRTPDEDVQSVRITYFNAWPEPGTGYNDLPDIASRARVFDRALASMAAMGPDRIVIACNTLSIVYPHTAFSRTTAIPVLGIVDAGVDLFYEALTTDPASSIVMFGTRTTIESGVHRDRLIARGIAARRITGVSCHGLAKAIETDEGGEVIADFIEKCTARACQADPPGSPLYLGVCCTHYTYVKEEMRTALERRCGRRVDTLDPNGRLVAELLRQTGRGQGEGRASSAPTVNGLAEARSAEGRASSAPTVNGLAEARSAPTVNGLAEAGAAPAVNGLAEAGAAPTVNGLAEAGSAPTVNGLAEAGSAATVAEAGTGRGSRPARSRPREEQILSHIPTAVTVVSKVELDDKRRRSMARRVEAISPATAAALLSYTRVVDLF